MKPPSFWKYPNSLLAKLLWPLSLIYLLGYKIRLAVTMPRKVPIPVICVGNIVVGGSGKTPTCLALYDLLKELGFTPHFLTRGYKGTLPGPVQVDPESHSTKDVGDEALLLARKGPTWVSKDKYLGAKAAQDHGATLLILDDGFQNPSLHKDISLLVIDGDPPFGNGLVLPAGPLREPFSYAIERAHGLILMSSTPCPSSSKPTFGAKVIPTLPHPPGKVLAFAGIGRPEKFFKTLEDLKIDCVAKFPFPDHHFYRQAELDHLTKLATKMGARLITTEKDFVRLPKEMKPQILTLPISLEWTDREGLKDFLKTNLCEK